jgi:ferredoxin
MELIKVQQSLCVKCGICMEICPPKILSMGENGPMASNV